MNKLQMADIVRALESVRGAPVLTSNQCWDLAQALNSAVPEAPPQEPVAIIGRDWSLLWFSPVGMETHAALCERTGLEIGDKLYRIPQEQPAPEQIDEAGDWMHSSSKCLACGETHPGSGNLPCPKMRPMA